MGKETLEPSGNRDRRGRPQAVLDQHGDFSMEGLCHAILERHRGTIRVQKPRIAVAKLARIVETILSLSNRQGFHATSLREISAASGVSMGSLYSYFDSKDTLLLMILGQVATTTSTVLGNAPATVKDDPAAHLRWLIATHVALTEAMLPWFVFAFMEAKSFPSQGRKAAVESEEATEAIFRDVIARGAQQGAFAVDDPAFAAALLKPLLQDWYVKRAKWHRRGLDAEGYAACVEAFVGKALGAAREGAREP
ncbi:MAG: TetR/AcrR family transcriptional regulator [Aquamicrobium sp.]|uniref:TetR/AcrR family transcriptional regulator n=1 Tax=Aquamicrobium sp. TaxID=1872579 RepID=UPI00349EAEBF|nr:TetR/AcrR family transcriptional regulator [Aquamicrobium sp.]